MKLHAPKIMLLACCVLFVQMPVVLAANVCSENTVVGPEAMARTWVNARQIARTEWASVVRSGLGRSYHKWNFAQKRGYMCWANGAQKYCKASATPCNGRNTLASSSSRRDNRRFANDRSDRNLQDNARRDSRENRTDNSSNETEERPLRAKRGYLDKRLADQYSGNQKCASRSTRISGKVSRGLKAARSSAQSLWSEYVGITQGNRWSGWQNARERHVKCSPAGNRIRCEVSANACLSGGAFDGRQRVEDNGRQRDNRISLPVRRPDIDDFAYDERAQDPGEYGDGNVGEADGKMELPEKKDGFALPWLVEPPVGRPEPEGGEGEPFGSREKLNDFDISSLEQSRQGRGSSQDRTRYKKRQGFNAPALPVKRPLYDEIQAGLEQQNNYYARGDNFRQGYGEDRRQEDVKKSAQMTLPQLRPERNSKRKDRTERRFSQNFNTDSDEEEPTRKRPRKKPSQNWNSDEEQQGPVRKEFERIRDRKRRPEDARREEPRKRNWSQDRSPDRENTDNAREKNSGKERFQANGRQRSGNRQGQAQKTRSKKWRSQKQQSRGVKKFQGWKAEEDADRNIVRRRGKSLADKLPSWKREKKKSEKRALAGSKIRYTSNAAVLRNPNTFYGCKEEEVASWGKPQPTKPQARQQAIRNWQKVIYKKYGKNWSDWMKAGSSRVQCGTQNGMRKCVAIANPCGAIMPKKGDEYNSVARCRIYSVSYSGSRSRNLAQAKQNAMNVWEKKIEKKYGAKWSDWFRSMEYSIKCSGKSRGKKRCKATAIPCST